MLVASLATQTDWTMTDARWASAASIRGWSIDIATDPDDRRHAPVIIKKMEFRNWSVCKRKFYRGIDFAGYYWI